MSDPPTAPHHSPSGRAIFSAVAVHHRRRAIGARRWRRATALVGVVFAVAACGGAGTTAATSKGHPSSEPTSSTRSTSTQGRSATTVTATVAAFRLPATLSRAVAVTQADGQIEVLGGLHDGERSTNAVLSIDPRSQSVTVSARLPVAVHDVAGGLLGGVPTTLGGGNSREVADVQQVTPRGAAVVGSLPVPTSDAVAVSTDRGLVLVGGYDGTRTLDQILLVTSPGQIRRIGSLPTPVRYPAVAVLGSGATQRVLVIGGESGGIATTAVQEVDPLSGSARTIGHLPAARTQASALRLGGSVFVFGGASSGTPSATEFSDVLRWSPSTSSFAVAGHLPYPVADAAAVSPDGRVGYLMGGEGPARVDTTIIVQAG